jgi:hypothetical protein
LHKTLGPEGPKRTQSALQITPLSKYSPTVFIEDCFDIKLGDALTLACSLRDLLSGFDLYQMEPDSTGNEGLDLALSLDQLEAEVI